MLGLCDELGRRGSADAGGLGRAPAGLRARREREERAGLLGWAGPELSLGPVGFGFAFLFLLLSKSNSNKV